MVRINKKYTKEQIQESVKLSESYSDVFRNLGIGINGGSYKWIKGLISKYEIDVSHFLSATELGNRQARINKIKKDINSDDISTGNRLNASRLQKFMFSKGMKHICNECGLNEWRGIPIRLDIDHIDNNPINNHITNLQFICPNCHRQKTIKYIPAIDEEFIENRKNLLIKDVFISNHRLPKIKKECSDCGKFIDDYATRCRSCAAKGRTYVDWPDDETLKKMVWEQPMFNIAKELKCSDVAIAKRCKGKGFDTPKRGYWRKLQTGKL